MQYETRNDESAYVSHVMEIPLLIRALNDSTTAGYITCIITLMAAGIYGQKGGGEGSSFFHFFFRFAGTDAFALLSTGEEAIDEGPLIGPTETIFVIAYNRRYPGIIVLFDI